MVHHNIVLVNDHGSFMENGSREIVDNVGNPIGFVCATFLASEY